MITIQILDIDPWLVGLRQLDSIQPITPDIEAGADVLINEARTYPPEPAGSTYQRTGDLGDGWQRTTSSAPTMISIDVFNLVEYGPFVQGPQQAPIHQGRWRPIDEIGVETTDRIVGLASDGVDGWITAAGLR